MNDGEGRTRRTNYMAIGTLQNAPCKRCGRDTMHKNRRCLDCQDQPTQSIEPDARRGKVSNRKPVKS